MPSPAIPHAPTQTPNPRQKAATADRLLTVDEAAERPGTGVRFIRRLIAERRIAYAKLGTHVRISETALDAYIVANTVQPAARRTRSHYGRAA